VLMLVPVQMLVQWYSVVSNTVHWTMLWATYLSDTNDLWLANI